MNYKDAQDIVSKMEILEAKFKRAVHCWQGNTDSCGYNKYPPTNERFNLMKIAFDSLVAYRQEVGVE